MLSLKWTAGENNLKRSSGSNPFVDPCFAELVNDFARAWTGAWPPASTRPTW
jgi:hypothetical protein